MMKKITFSALLPIMLLSTHLFGQIKVHDGGKINFGGVPNNWTASQVYLNGGTTNTDLFIEHNNLNSWTQGINTNVYNADAVSYHLMLSNGAGLVYSCAQGYVFAVNGVFQPSDSSLKTKIVKLTNSLDQIRTIGGYHYFYKPVKLEVGIDKGKTFYPDTIQHTGLMASEIKNVVPDAVRIGENGKEIMNYSLLIPLLVESIKELDANNTKQSNDLALLQSKFNRLMSNVDSSGGGYKLKPANPSTDFILDQNSPNPWNQDTRITYSLKGSYTSAYIYIFDLQGGWKKTYNLANYSGSITIKSSDLQPGMYLYSLVVDGKEIDIKRMLLTN